MINGFWQLLFTSFRQLSDGFSLYVANQNARTVRGKVINCSSILIRYSRTLLFRTRLIQSPRYFEVRPNSLGFTLTFSVIYYQLFRTRLLWTPRYFELNVVSLDLKSTLSQPHYFELVDFAGQTEYMYVRAQIQTHCILNELILVCDLTLLLSFLTCNHCYFKNHCLLPYCISLKKKRNSLFKHFMPTQLFRNPAILNFFFHLIWDFNIVGFHCSLPLFSLIHNFSNQNACGNVSKISVNHADDIP